MDRKAGTQRDHVFPEQSADSYLRWYKQPCVFVVVVELDRQTAREGARSVRESGRVRDRDSEIVISCEIVINCARGPCECSETQIQWQRYEGMQTERPSETQRHKQRHTGSETRRG